MSDARVGNITFYLRSLANDEWILWGERRNNGTYDVGRPEHEELQKIASRFYNYDKDYDWHKIARSIVPLFLAMSCYLSIATHLKLFLFIVF